MNRADEQVLAALTPFMSDLGAAHVRQAVVKAGGIRQLTDATAISELEMAKRKFSSRSAAGTYAANVRWRGSREEWLAPDRSGAKARSAIMGTKGAQFEVKPITASRVKVGDIVSSGSNRVPTKVLEITARGDRVEMRVQGLDARKGTPPIVTTTLRPGSEMRLWSVLEVEKAERRSFGSRSEAGRYAAQVRWARRGQAAGGSSGATAGGGDGMNQSQTSLVGAMEQTMSNVEQIAANTRPNLGGILPQRYNKDLDAAETAARESLKGVMDQVRANMVTDATPRQLRSEARVLRTKATKTYKQGTEQAQLATSGPKVDNIMAANARASLALGDAFKAIADQLETAAIALVYNR